MKNRGIFSVIITVLFVFSAYAQINLLSNDINFRTSADKIRQTIHYGRLKLYSGVTEGIWAKNEKSDNTSYAYYGECINSGNGARYGGYFKAAYGAGANYGVYAYAYGGNGTRNGICAYAPTGQGSLAGYFIGDVTVTGTFLNPSDVKFKKNIEPLDNCLAKIMELKPKMYNYDTENYKGMGFGNKKCFGLIAQDVENVLPTIVEDKRTNPVNEETGEPDENSELTFKSISYLELIPVLVGAIQDQQKEIEALKEELRNAVAK